jgi:hypothetical protein
MQELNAEKVEIRHGSLMYCTDSPMQSKVLTFFHLRAFKFQLELIIMEDGI